MVVEGKETGEFTGRPFVIERALVADVCLVKAWKADAAGTVVLHRRGWNLSAASGMGGETWVIEAEEMWEVGGMGWAQVHLHGL